MAADMQFQDSPQIPLARDMSPPDQKSMWPWKRWFSKDDSTCPASNPQDPPERPNIARRFSKKAIPGLPRPGTFKRQQSELRDRLEPVNLRASERRAFSVDRRPKGQSRAVSASAITPLPRVSAPAFGGRTDTCRNLSETKGYDGNEHDEDIEHRIIEELKEPIPLTNSTKDGESESAADFDDDLLEELEKRWILNLSMHFRDRSNREKFFVTFAESPGCWRRVTISLDYRNAAPGSLEEELQRIHFQRDKSARIYESIRESLADIQFYDTVTNLKLQTENDRLHVHVTEDIHEVIRYPPVSAINHLNCPRIREDQLDFDSHLSGFVYKVKFKNHVLIKKEIPGPDTVEEFLYEINALHRLSGSSSVIQFGGVVTDVEEKVLKGLLISYAEKGALIDVIFDEKGALSWPRRERWAKQIVQGLSEIHEAGFVQGDFTLSNIVIDGDDKAKIIDINRRGCPVGWEPPEVSDLIASKQRISMYIGVKSDLFQLGMVLWAIAMEQDEPEIQPKPLTLAEVPEEIPEYFRDLVGLCLSDDPKDRCHATMLMRLFPDLQDAPSRIQESTRDEAGVGVTSPTTGAGVNEIEEMSLARAPSPDATRSITSIGTQPPLNTLTNNPGVVEHFPPRGRSPPSSLPDTEDQRLDDIVHENTHDETQQKGDIEVHVPEARVITVSPSRQQQTQIAEHSRTTDATPDSDPGDLVGVGEHSTLEHSAIPQGIDDDDFMIDM